MIVIPLSIPGQGRASNGAAVVALNFAAVLSGLLLAAGVCRGETFSNLEGVDTNGVSTWKGTLPVTLVGVLLTDPSEMLDSTPAFVPWDNGAGIYQMGGQWQVFVQAIAPSDRGGVECWMAQNYGNLPWEPHDGSDSYPNEVWSAEVNRVSHDPVTGRAFRKGDLVMITANGTLFYGGQQNINEEHSTDSAMDFSISLVAADFGLPAPEVLSLSSVMRPDDGNATTHEDIFDATRATGGEHYQGMRVRINGLSLVSTNGWSSTPDWDSRYCIATDSEGRQFPLIHPLYDLGPAPTNRFDATGVFMQESGSGTDGTFGYELFVQEIAPSSDATLSIAEKPVISWPAALSNYQVVGADSVTSTNWSAVNASPVVVNGQNTLIVEPGSASKFYRLERTH